MDKFSVPVALFQGLEDKVVPPNQAEEVYEQLSAKGVPTVCVLFEGEQVWLRARLRLCVRARAACVARLLCRSLAHMRLTSRRGEQHGFRRSANIRRALDSELQFYGSVFGFEPPMPDDHVDLPMGEKVTVALGEEVTAAAS